MTNQITKTCKVSIEGNKFPFTSFEDVSKRYREAIEMTGATISGRTGPPAPRCHILDHDDNVVAHVSYNGRIWSGEKYVPNAKPIYCPNVNAAPFSGI